MGTMEGHAAGCSRRGHSVGNDGKLKSNMVRLNCVLCESSNRII